MRKFWESIYRPNYINGYNPFIINNMNKAIERVVEAINNREKIVLYGRCDVDGICGISSLMLILKYLNADVEYCIEECNLGEHEITEEIIENKIHFLGADLLISVGCGLASQKEENLCEKLGIDLIIMENKKEHNVYRSIYINPKQKECSYRYKNLSNSGLTFKFMQAIAIYYNMKRINKYLDLILIGSHSCKVEKHGENGVFLKEGVRFLENTNNYGLREIIKYLNIIKIDESALDSIIEMITPSKNAVGKTDNARIVVELLTTTNKYRAEQITKFISNEKNR